MSDSSQFTNTNSLLYGWMEPATINFSASGTYTGVPFTNTTTVTTHGTGIKLGNDATSGYLQLSDKGVYWVQFQFTFTGGANDPYYLLWKDANDIDYRYTLTRFTTKGSSQWEVEMCFLLLNNVPKDEFSYTNLWRLYARNNSDTSSLNITNLNYLVFKIS